MSRLEKLTHGIPSLQEAMKQIAKPWTWLVLAESWCGDAAQCVPVLHNIAEQSPNVRFRLVFRDRHPDLMNDYLTNGGRSIPKLICLRDAPITGPQFTEIGTWGPRPAGLQALMVGWRTEKLALAEANERAQRWYNDDHIESLQAELLALVASWSKEKV